MRLSSREAGIDNSGAANKGPAGAQVYLQIKNPNSKYQQGSQGMEHKVFARDYQYRFQNNNSNANNGSLLDSGSSAELINGGGYDTPQIYSVGDRGYAGLNRFTDSNGNVYYVRNRGSIGGTEDAPGAAVPGPATNASDTISIGRDGGGVNGEGVADINGSPSPTPIRNRSSRGLPAATRTSLSRGGRSSSAR